MITNRVTFYIFSTLAIGLYLAAEIGIAILAERERNKGMVHVNLSDVENEFEVLPEGLYNATLVDTDVVERDDPDKYTYIKWEFKLTDKPGKAWTNTSLSPNALFKLRELLEAVGEEEDVLDDEEGFDIDPADYIGEDVTLHLTVGSWKGKAKNEVEAVLPLQEEKTSRKKKKKAKDVEDDDDDEVEEKPTRKKKKSRRRVV